MKLEGFLGPSGQMRSLPLNAERSINLYPVLDQRGSSVGSLYGTPGKNLFGVIGVGPGRGGFASTNNRVFAVSGSVLYELQGDGTSTNRGSLDTSSGIITADENGAQLAICDGVNLYIFTYATNAFAKVVVAGLPSAASVTFLDGYFIVSRSPSSGIFQISALYDGLTWSALDFATAESSPDALLRVLNVAGQLWLFGTKTTEVYYNAGGATFPFQRIAGGKMEVGTAAPYSVIALDNTAFWIGRDNNGSGIVYRAEGFTPKQVSTEPIELLIQSSTDPLSFRTYAAQMDGHVFLSITGGGLETSPILDLTTKLWHEKAYLNDQGNYEQDLGIFGMFAFSKQLLLDRINGNVYEQSLNFFTDNGEEIARDRIFTNLIEENKRFTVSNLTMGFETGIGTQTGAGVDPVAVLHVSRDGGRTFFGGWSKSLGRAGKFLTRVRWDRIGQFRMFTARVRVTSPNKVCLTGAWANT